MCWLAARVFRLRDNHFSFSSQLKSLPLAQSTHWHLLSLRLTRATTLLRRKCILIFCTTHDACESNADPSPIKFGNRCAVCVFFDLWPQLEVELKSLKTFFLSGELCRNQHFHIDFPKKTFYSAPLISTNNLSNLTNANNLF